MLFVKHICTFSYAYYVSYIHCPVHVACEKPRCHFAGCALQTMFNQLVGAAFGTAGQLCMTLSTVVFVGEARIWLNELVWQASHLNSSAGNDVFSVLFWEIPSNRPFLSMESSVFETRLVLKTKNHKKPSGSVVFSNSSIRLFTIIQLGFLFNRGISWYRLDF